MGRTITTATQQIAREEDGWRAFRRALRLEDRRAFDRLFDLARRHAAPLSQARRLLPFEGIVLAMLLELLKRIDDLERRLAALEE